MPHIKSKHIEIIGKIEALEQSSYERGARDAIRHFERVKTWLDNLPYQSDKGYTLEKVLEWVVSENEQVHKDFPFLDT